MFGKEKKTGKKILIVEDDAMLHKVLVEQMKKAGFATKSAMTGIEALDILKSFKPDLILLDLILPELDGFEVLKKLGANEKTAKIPVVIVSNLEDAGEVKSATALGAKKYFIKANTQISEITAYVKTVLKV